MARRRTISPREGNREANDGLKEIFSAEGVQYVWAIRQTPDGNLYAATGPHGQLWEIKPDGSKRVVLDSDENNLTALVSRRQGHALRRDRPERAALPREPQDRRELRAASMRRRRRSAAW